MPTVAEVMRNQAPETYTGAWLAAGKNKELADLIWEAALKRILRRSRAIDMRTALRERVRAKLIARASQQCPWTNDVIVRWAKETTVYINRGQTILNLRPGDTFYRDGENFITVGKTYTKTWKKKKYAVTCIGTVASNP